MSCLRNSYDSHLNHFLLNCVTLGNSNCYEDMIYLDLQTLPPKVFKTGFFVKINKNCKRYKSVILLKKTCKTSHYFISKLTIKISAYLDCALGHFGRSPAYVYLLIGTFDMVCVRILALYKEMSLYYNPVKFLIKSIVFDKLFNCRSLLSRMGAEWLLPS